MRIDINRKVNALFFCCGHQCRYGCVVVRTVAVFGTDGYLTFRTVEAFTYTAISTASTSLTGAGR